MRRLIVVLALTAASCGGGSGASDAVIERQVGGQAFDDPASTVCDDIEAFALGAASGGDLSDVLDELARLGAVLGATGALAPMAAVEEALAEGSTGIAHDLADAAAAIDAAGYERCEIPPFTAMYVSTSFASCFGRAAISAGTLTPDTTGCETDRGPSFLPCFDPEQGYVPVDCRTGATVVLRDGSWVEA